MKRYDTVVGAFVQQAMPLYTNLTAAIYQQRQDTQIEYLWPGFTLLSNKADISDIDFSKINPNI